jgi:hypothetical protein
MKEKGVLFFVIFIMAITYSCGKKKGIIPEEYGFLIGTWVNSNKNEVVSKICIHPNSCNIEYNSIRNDKMVFGKVSSRESTSQNGIKSKTIEISNKSSNNKLLKSIIIYMQQENGQYLDDKIMVLSPGDNVYYSMDTLSFSIFKKQ